MPHYRTNWLLLALLLAPMPFLLLRALGPGTAIWQQHLWDIGHIPLFALWTIAALRWLPLPLTPAFIALRCGALLGLGLLIEFAQRETGRSFSLTDVYLDGCGIALGVRLMCFSRRRLYVADAMLLMLLAIGVRDAVVHLADRAYMSWQFPQLWQADQPNATLRIGGSAQFRLVQRETRTLLEVVHDTRQYSGIELHSLSADWRHCQTLQIEVLNPAPQALDLVCRVHDRLHYRNGAALDDRFNRRFTLHPGWNTLTVPLAEIESAPRTRRMQLDGIENLMCFTIALPAPRTLYYREIRLQR